MTNNSLSDAARLAYLEWAVMEEVSVEKMIVRARDYYGGKHPTFLTARLKEFLNLDTAGNEDITFHMNFCKPVVNAVVERLRVMAFHSTSTALAKQLNDWWEADLMPAKQIDVHRAAVRDGETFVIVDWDVVNQRPRIMPHPRFTSSQAGGDNFGCKIHFPNDDTNQPPLYASKRWIEDLGERDSSRRGQTRERLTLYLPDRIEKYEVVGGQSLAIRDPDDTAWPLPWVGADGLPLGIPVINFRNPERASEIQEAIPIQDAINKSVIDMLASADVSAFQFFVTIGWIPTSDNLDPKADGSNAVVIQPGRILGTNKMPSEATFQTVQPGELSPLREVVQDLVLYLAVVTDTPIGRFQFVRQVAAEGTLKQQEAPLLAKVDDRQATFGGAWKDVARMALKLSNEFGGTTWDVATDIIPRWNKPDVRSQSELISEWSSKKENAVPAPQIWREMGYTEDQIEQFKQEPEYAARLAMLELSMQNAQMTSQTPPATPSQPAAAGQSNAKAAAAEKMPMAMQQAAKARQVASGKM